MARYKGEKGKAWDAVKRFVRERERDCYTCPSRNLTGINAQAGHCWPVGHVGSNNTLSWDERQIHLQCSRCNGAGQGEQATYKIRLIADYGEQAVKELEARRWKVDPIKDWKAIIDHYNKLYDECNRRISRRSSKILGESREDDFLLVVESG